MEEKIGKYEDLLSGLSDEEKAYAEQFADTIDISDASCVLHYGGAAQKKVTQFSESSLFEIPSTDLNEIAKDIRKLKKKLTEFRNHFAKAESTGTNDMAAFRSMYDTFSSAMIEAGRRMEIHRSSLIRHISKLDRYYEKCTRIIREFDMYVYAGKKHLDLCREEKLEELNAKAAKGAMEDAVLARDYAAACLRFEKKLADLAVSRTLPFQIMTHIRLMQNTDAMLAESLHRLCSDTFPLYRTRLIFSLGLQEEKTISPDTFREAADDLDQALDAILKLEKESTDKQKKGIRLFG